MGTIPVRQPRYIDPSVIEIGDDVAVEHTASKGVVTTVRGIVAKRIDSGSTRYYVTAEGGTLFSWEPGKRNGIKVTLFGRSEQPQETLDWLDESRLRAS